MAVVVRSCDSSNCTSWFQIVATDLNPLPCQQGAELFRKRVHRWQLGTADEDWNHPFSGALECRDEFKPHPVVLLVYSPAAPLIRDAYPVRANYDENCISVNYSFIQDIGPLLAA